MAERKARMTEKERVEALIRHEKPDRVPIWPFAETSYAAYAQISIADTYNNPAAALDGQRRTCDYFQWVCAPWIGYAAYGGWEFGGDIKWPSGEYAQAPAITRYPVEKVEDVYKVKLPDVKTAGFTPIEKEFYDLAVKEGFDNEPFNVTIFPGAAVFSIAANICGPGTFCKWLLKEPEAVHHLLRLAEDHCIDKTRYFKSIYGIEGVLPMGGEATTDNRLISAKQFEEFALPYLKEAYQKVLDMGYKVIYSHICGEQNANLPFWAQIPMGEPGIISIGHEIEIETAAEYFPDHIILGNLEPAKLQVETPEEIYEASRDLIERGKKIAGGFIYSPGCGMPPMAPIENMMAMTRAVNDFGWYD